jgi:hypothetical protein
VTSFPATLRHHTPLTGQNFACIFGLVHLLFGEPAVWRVAKVVNILLGMICRNVDVGFL